jgi:AbrB family looped-hinge helix DNA binding protein
MSTPAKNTPIQPSPAALTPILEVRARMNESGRVVLPKQLRELLGAEPGDALIFTSDGETVRIETQKQRMKRAQDYIRNLVGPGRSLVDELIAERREEFRKEMAE